MKLEGGGPARVAAARACVDAGIAVMGHVGLTPQAISVLGGFRPQGRTFEEAAEVVERALELERAGCFSVVGRLYKFNPADSQLESAPGFNP